MVIRMLVALAMLLACTSEVHPAEALPESKPPLVKKRGAVSAVAKSLVGKVVQRGKVSWYGRRFAGKTTASGERYDPAALTMAHRSLPLGAVVDVTNNANGRHLRVRVNDRGPYCPGRVADLSRAASQRLGFKDKGVTEATIRVVSVPKESPVTLASDTTQRDSNASAM
ncbi:MAG TPA: septal ring lytic transglycosylase RlpA family protein [Casimicrobiaceae bacterium]|nr:septal ring lytic transglycosylase RlpA family protein [Casimicrobiaceae bacterium]